MNRLWLQRSLPAAAGILVGFVGCERPPPDAPAAAERHAGEGVSRSARTVLLHAGGRNLGQAETSTQSSIEEAARAREIGSRENDAAGPVHFSALAPEPDMVSRPYAAPLSAYVGRIYAAFDAGDARFRDRNQIVAKWVGPGGEVLFVSHVRIAPNARLNYVWLERSRWSDGHHNVLIFGVEEALPLLAAGSFTIADVPEYLSFRLLQVPQQDASSDSFPAAAAILLATRHRTLRARMLDAALESADTGRRYHAVQIFLAPAADASVIHTLKARDHPIAAGRYRIAVSANGEFVGSLPFAVH